MSIISLSAVLLYQFHAICRPLKGCRSYLQGTPHLYAHLSESLEAECLETCFIMYFHRKFQPNNYRPLYLTCAKTPKSDGNVNNSTSSLCSMLDAVFPTLYTWYPVCAAGIHCHLEESLAMFLGDKMLGFLKKFWNDLFQITLLKDPSWRRRENVLVNDTVEQLIRTL